MTRIQVFQNPEFGEVRITDYNGEIAFVAKDVAERLGYTAFHPIIIAHVPDEWKGRNRITTLGGEQEVWVLTEQGLYFFLARSDKPLALPFHKWIAGEVIPSIRKTERLGYSWNTSILKRIPAEWKGRNRITTLGGEQGMRILAVQGFYSFIARSDKPLRGELHAKNQTRSTKVAGVTSDVPPTGTWEIAVIHADSSRRLPT